MYPVDPRFWLQDTNVRTLGPLDVRCDLTAPDVETAGTNQIVVGRIRAPKSQVYVFKTFVPYAMERVNVGNAATETFQMMNPVTSNGFFVFEPVVTQGAPHIMGTDYNRPRLAAAPLNNDRSASKGIASISQNPWLDTQRAMFNPLFTIVVPSDKEFTVLFSILPVGTASPIPAGGQFGIGGAGGTRRVDFAGFMVSGVQMSQQHYDNTFAKVDAEPGVA